jgi:hypothetical protein
MMNDELKVSFIIHPSSLKLWRGVRDSNSRPSVPKTDALSTELTPRTRRTNIPITFLFDSSQTALSISDFMAVGNFQLPDERVKEKFYSLNLLSFLLLPRFQSRFGRFESRDFWE